MAVLSRYQKQKKSCILNKIWRLPLSLSILNQTQAMQFLMGASSENTNHKWLTAVYFSKNNTDIFNWNFSRTKCINFYWGLRWIQVTALTTSRITHNQPLKIMFASSTTSFANLMFWAGQSTNSPCSGNRWLGGHLSAQTKLKSLPNFLFVPDPEKNLMIIKEALQKKIVMVAIINTDTFFTGDVSLYGNNRAFRYISQITELLLKLSKQQKWNVSLLSAKAHTQPAKWFFSRTTNIV